jgi:acetyl esterase/lipase
MQTSALPQPHQPVQRDVTYCIMDGVPLKADIYFAQNTQGPAPLLIFVHGGTWTSGSRSGGMGFDGLTAFTQMGYTLASIDYRLAPQYKMPAMIQDVKCAVRSFRAHAAEYGIDPDRIGAIGASAGGHLVAMLGTTDGSEGFDVGEYQGYSSRVQAVVDMAGPTDLRSPFAADSELVADQVFGTRDPADPIFAAASPVTWVTPDNAPFLIIHGENDERVPLAQSQALYEKLLAAGVEARLIVVKNAGHSMENPNQSPTRQELVVTILQFLQEKLR